MSTAADFVLHPRLEEDCVPLGRLTLCRVLLMSDARFPWCLLVPERPDIHEIYALDDQDQQLLMRESVIVCRALVDAFRPDKLNVAALGNQVPQLHLHHVARFRTDAAWPRPVWGSGEAEAYGSAALGATSERLIQALSATADAAGMQFTPW